MGRLLQLAIRGYQLSLSPLLAAVLGPQCRFHPSCSQYAMDAIEKYGAIKGSWFAARRLLRCQPFCEGGYDPVL